MRGVTDASTAPCPPSLRAVLTGDDPEASWQDDAACAGMDPAIFFPPKGQNALEAKAVCASCAVRDDCRTEGMSHRFGIWGGLTQKERRVVLRQQRRAS